LAFESDAARIDALTAASEVDPTTGVTNDPFAEHQAAGEQAQPATPAPSVEPGTTSPEDSFRGFDSTLFSTLTPEQQAHLELERKSIQGEATKRFQEAAELRKRFEGYEDIDPQVVADSVRYVQGLADPNFMLQARDALTEQLEKAGLTPAQATQVADEQLGSEDEYEYEDGVNPALEARLNKLEQQNAELEQERYQTYLANEALKQENYVRQANPTYTDDDMAWVLRLGFNTGGDLVKADGLYQEMQSHVAKSLLGSKTSIPAAISPPVSGGSGQQPVAPELNFEQAHKNAMARLAAAEANS
jgi:hypothetical protein